MTELKRRINCPKNINGCGGLPEEILDGGGLEIIKLKNWGNCVRNQEGNYIDIDVYCENFMGCYSILVKQDSTYRRSAILK